jgi:pimeloyl-ACP methyl ester carboxylesterase
VLAGYDIGSRIAQTVAQRRPDLVSAPVVSPPRRRAPSPPPSAGTAPAPAGHFTPLERPDEFTAAILSALPT